MNESSATATAFTNAAELSASPTPARSYDGVTLLRQWQQTPAVPPPWFTSARNRLMLLAGDTECDKRLAPNAFALLVLFVDQGFPPPYTIELNRNGEIQFEWESPEAYLEVVVDDLYGGHFLFQDLANKREVEDRIGNFSTPSIVHFLKEAAICASKRQQSPKIRSHGACTPPI